MDCVYKVNRYYGNYDSKSHIERESKTGVVSEFFPGGVAFIEYTVTPCYEGGSALSYKATTANGEVIAIKRWNTRHESEYTAAINAIETACDAIFAYDSRVRCLVGDVDADVLLDDLNKAEQRRLKELAERSEVDC